MREIELNQKLEEPKPKKPKPTESNEEFADLIRWNQPEASDALRPLLNEYRRYVCERAAICIQQSFRKYLLLIGKASIRSGRRLEAFGEEDRCSADCSDNWPNEYTADRRSPNGRDPGEECKVHSMHRSFGVRAGSEALDSSLNPNCSGERTPDCDPNYKHDHRSDRTACSTDGLDEAADRSKDSPNDGCSASSCFPHCGRLAEGSFKSKKNELLNCSMDVVDLEMCPTKEEHPFDELKDKRCSASSASLDGERLSCMEKLSAKR